MSALRTADFLKVFNARREHCFALLELSRKQLNLIDSEDYHTLLETLGRKQRILGHLDELNQLHPNLRVHWKSLRETAEPELRDQCEHALAETEAILAEILKEEHEGTDHLTERRDATQKQLQSLSQGTQVHTAYRDNLAPTTHRHLNIDQ